MRFNKRLFLPAYYHPMSNLVPLLYAMHASARAPVSTSNTEGNHNGLAMNRLETETPFPESRDEGTPNEPLVTGLDSPDAKPSRLLH